MKFLLSAGAFHTEKEQRNAPCVIDTRVFRKIKLHILDFARQNRSAVYFGIAGCSAGI